MCPNSDSHLFALGNVFRSGSDLVDGTPILDIKPYVSHYDSVAESRLPLWIDRQGTYGVTVHACGVAMGNAFKLPILTVASVLCVHNACVCPKTAQIRRSPMSCFLPPHSTRSTPSALT